MNAYIDMIKNAFDVRGRVGRHNYWLGILVHLVILWVLVWFYKKVPVLAFLPAIYAAAMAIPYITATLRRLNDTGKSRLWALMFLVPVFGWIVLFVFTIQETPVSVQSRDVRS